MASPARSRDRPLGFNVVGHFSTNGGVGVVARNVVRLIEGKGYAVATRNVDGPGGYAVERPSELPHPINLNILSVTALPDFVLLNPDLMTDQTLNVGFFWWELPVLPDIWIEALEFYDVLVAGSNFIRATFENSVSGPLTVTALPTLTLPDGINPSRERFGLPSGPVVFICIVEPSSDPERKNPFAAIDAFRRVFDSDPRAHLVVKVNSARIAEMPVPIHRKIRDYCATNPRIHLIEENLSYVDVLSLYAACDVFVALHRSEGLGLGPMEAMTLGKPVIATAWSGNTLFMNHTNSCLVRYDLIPAEGSSHVYTHAFLGKEATWADPDIDDAAQWMKALVDDPALRSDIGAKARTSAAALQREAERAEFVDELRLIWEHRQLATAPARHRRSFQHLRDIAFEHSSSKGQVAMRKAHRLYEKYVGWRFRPG